LDMEEPGAQRQRRSQGHPQSRILINQVLNTANWRSETAVCRSLSFQEVGGGADSGHRKDFEPDERLGSTIFILLSSGHIENVLWADAISVLERSCRKTLIRINQGQRGATSSPGKAVALFTS
jgi:hypothetical protein